MFSVSFFRIDKKQYRRRVLLCKLKENHTCCLILYILYGVFSVFSFLAALKVMLKTTLSVQFVLQKTGKQTCHSVEKCVEGEILDQNVQSI